MCLDGVPYQPMLLECIWNAQFFYQADVFWMNFSTGLLVVSSLDESPLKRISDLCKPEALPALLNEGAMDPNMLKHHILVHDKQMGPPDR